MAWPSYVQPGQDIVSSQYNALVDALKQWGGTVDGGGYALQNLAGLALAANSVLDVSAGGCVLRGDLIQTGKLTVSASPSDGTAFVVYTPSQQTLAVVTGAGTPNVQLRSSTNVIMAAAADGSRLIRLETPPSKQEALSTATGRLTMSGSFDVTGALTVAQGVTLSGAVTLGSLTVNGDATLSGNVSIAGTVNTGAADGFLHIAPYVRVSQLQANAGLVATSADWSKTASLTVDASGNATLGLNTANAYVNSSANLQVSGWLRAVGASGLYVYSPDLSRYLQVSCANGANPLIASSTNQVNFTCEVNCMNAGGFVCYSSADYSRYGQFSTAAAAGSHPTIASSTGTLIISPALSLQGVLNTSSNIGINAGQALYVYNSANSQYLTIALGSGNFPQIAATTYPIQFNGSIVSQNRVTAAVDLLVNGSGGASGYLQFAMVANQISGRSNGWLYSSTGTLDVVGSFYVNNVLTVNGATTHTGAVTCSNGLTVTAGNLDANIAIRALNNAQLTWFNTGNAQYGICGWNGSNPAIGSSTGVFFVNNALTVAGNFTVNAATAAGAQINLVNSANSWLQVVMAGSSGTGMNIGVSNNIQGGLQPYIYSATATLNISANLLYVTGQVSATAHLTHASGSDIRDIQRAFYRTEEQPNEDGEMTEHVVAANAWTLAPADDGLHILCKRSETEVVEWVLFWADAKPVPNPKEGE